LRVKAIKACAGLAAFAAFTFASTSAVASEGEVELAASAPGSSDAPPPAPSVPKPARRSRWYGWQNLAADGASLSLVVSGLAVGDKGGSYLAGAGAAGWALGGPLIHFGHKNPGRAMASFGLHVVLPVGLGAGTVALVCRGGGDFCGLLAFPGALVGVVIAVVVDGAVLARDEVPVEQADRVGRVRITPTFGPVPHGAVAGLALTL